MKDYYDILGVSPTSEAVVIRAAYKAMMLRYHPDTNKSPDSEERSKEINEAFSVLNDTEKRARYDGQRAGFHGGGSDGGNSNPPPPPKTPPTPKASEGEGKSEPSERQLKTAGVNGAYVLGACAIAISIITLISQNHPNTVLTTEARTDQALQQISSVPSPIQAIAQTVELPSLDTVIEFQDARLCEMTDRTFKIFRN